MKKKYSLDYNIERDTDRLQAVRDILDGLDTDPNPTDLEQMASYILYGKDENGLNAVQRGETTDTNKRYSSFKKKADKLQSLDAILENPMVDPQSLKDLETRCIYTKKKPEIHRAKYDKKGNLVDPGDSDIPYMKELWERIDYLEEVLAANKGDIPFKDNYSVISDPYYQYLLQHQIIDMRRHQYYLKDAYRPALHFLAVKPPQPQTINFDADSFYWMPFDQWQTRVDNELSRYISKDINDYETKEVDGQLMVKWVVRHQQFDWEDPKHIVALINNYSAIYMQDWDKLHSWGRTLIFDFDRYVDMANLSPLRQYILLRKIDKASMSDITREIKEKFDVEYNENHLTIVLNKEIPRKIVTAVRRHRLLLEVPESKWRPCHTCGERYPLDTVFFGINRSRSDGFCTNCKECERKRRQARKGGNKLYDGRSKDQTMYKVPTGETNS